MDCISLGRAYVRPLVVVHSLCDAGALLMASPAVRPGSRTGVVPFVADHDGATGVLPFVADHDGGPAVSSFASDEDEEIVGQ